jgi:hypothetical protein
MLGDLSELSEQPTGIKGIGGSIVQGIPLDVEITILGVANAGSDRDIPELSGIRERIWLYDGNWPLLGQTWFEKVGVNFQNFQSGPRSRRFGLYACPPWPRNSSQGR